MKIFKNIRYFLEYLVAASVLWLVRHLPMVSLSHLANAGEFVSRLLFPYMRLIEANIHAAMPGLNHKEVVKIRKKSFYHMLYNILEFIWTNGEPRRILNCYYVSPETVNMVRSYVDAGVRVIFVNPHLGSWEASGVMAPFYGGIKMAAVAKPVSNPYLNKLLNNNGRGKVNGLQIIFSHGAARAAIKALKAGLCLGMLIDQNTRLRDGGEFLDFFGIPVASSIAPAVIKRYCDAHGVPTVIFYAASVRLRDKRVHVICEELPRPFDDYPDDKAVVQELMNISERYIRMYPEQYLWLYKRFRHIPPDTPEEVRKRYPYYAKVPSARFFSKVRRSTDK